MIRVLVLIAILAATMSGCAITVDKTAAEQAVAKFHAQLDAGHFDEIYDGTSADLRKMSSKQDLVALLESVHHRLGTTKSSTEQSWTVNYRGSGSFVTLKYKTVYSEGEVDEQFIYKMQGNTPSLAGYHFNSSAQVIK